MINFEDAMRLTRTVSGETALTDDDARGLYDCLIEVPRGGVVVETGCQLGRSSSLIAQVALHAGFHHIHIDPYVEQESEDYLQRWHRMMWKIGSPYVHVCAPTVEAWWILPKFIDMAFIDGDHELNGVLIDCELVANRVRPGGWLCAHDYANEGLAGVKAGFGEYIDDKWESHGVTGSLARWRRR